MSTDLEPVAPRAVQVNTDNPIGAMIQAALDKGITVENVAVVDKLMDLYLKVDAVEAKKLFAEAKAALQRDIPHVLATKPVPNRDGTVRYKYAPKEEIMRQVEPYLSKHGFSISFNQRVDAARLVAICTLTHVGGHSEATEFAVRVGQGPPNASEAQADGAASTYAQRFALCGALNVTIDIDDDARLVGEPISAEQAASLKGRLAALGENVSAFLKLAAAPSFEAIHSGKYAMLDAALQKKERAKPPTTLAPTASDPLDPEATITKDERDFLVKAGRRAGHKDDVMAQWLKLKYGCGSKDIKRHDYSAIVVRFRNPAPLTAELLREEPKIEEHE